MAAVGVPLEQLVDAVAARALLAARRGDMADGGGDLVERDGDRGRARGRVGELERVGGVGDDRGEVLRPAGGGDGLEHVLARADGDDLDAARHRDAQRHRRT